MIYLLIVLALLIVFVVALYNGLIKLRNKCDEAWADIDTQLKRRYDLIPNLVETVKGYASHEAGTLEKVTAARTAAMNAQGIAAKQQAENALSGVLKSIFALAESYPDLKANQNFLDLQKNLTDVEEHLQLSRRYYNATVRDFNTKIQVFPNNIIAKPLGFSDKEFFQAEGEEKENVKVSFSASAAPATKAATSPLSSQPTATTPTAPAAKPAATPPPPTPPATPTEPPKQA